MGKEALIDVNDFVLCPNGELGTVSCFLSDNSACVQNSFGTKSFRKEDLVKLNKLESSEKSGEVTSQAEVEVSNPYFRDELNPDLFKDMKLIPEVREALLKIADEFMKEVEQGEFKLPIVDINLVGSNASYNYSDMSDIDVHIVVDFSKFTDATDFFIKEYFEAKRKMFARQREILVKGRPVEVYIEDAKNKGVYNGIYSIINDQWVQVPSKDKVHIDTTAVQLKFDRLHEKITDVINLPGNMVDAVKVYKRIFDMRKSGLKNGGEFSVENLVFKKLRDNELIDRLREYMYKERDKELSLESAEDVITEAFKILRG